MHTKHLLFPLLVTHLALANAIIEPVPTITEVCKVASSQVSCGSFYAPQAYGTEYVGSSADAFWSGFGTTDGISLEVSAGAFALSTNYSPDNLESSAFASSALDFFGSTEGPLRPGLATYFLDTSQEAIAGSSGFITGLATCGPNCRSYGELVPFDLGTQFEIGLFALAFGRTYNLAFGGGAVSTIHLHLFETDGTPVAIFDPPASTAVPEPESWTMFALGLSGLVGMSRRCERFTR